MRNYTPPLLEDICALLEPDANAPSATMLARILTNLAACEVAEGGPYASTPGARTDTDLGMNIAIALFLRTLSVQLPNLDAYIENELGKHRPFSRYFTIEELKELRQKYDATYTPRAEPALSWTDAEMAMLTQIRDAMDRRFSALPKPFAHNARDVVNRTIKGNTDNQMSLMPLYVREALGKKGEQFSDTYLADLGLANVFFWTAFIIYDDFWDVDEAAEPYLLPAANLFARHYTQFFSTCAPGTAFSVYFHALMDSLDAANEWELLSCRLYRKGSTLLLPNHLPEYDDFSIKFYPAAGHILGPVLMLLQIGYSLESTEVQQLTEYFRHYLIAMQLNDDLHDWKEDLARGHVSTAVSCLLSVWRAAHLKERSIHLVDDMPELEQLFWNEVLPSLCESIRERTTLSQQALESLSCIENPAPLMQFIERNRNAAEAALQEKRKTSEFLIALAERERNISSDFV